jgi:hypothetical protein
MNDQHAPVVRRLLRAVALTPAILVSLAAAPALATAPDQWPEPAPVSTLHALLIVGAIPIGLFALITLLVYVPSMMRDEKYHPGLAWRSEPEWFGGPNGGIEAADKADPKAVEGAGAERGGASGSW